MKMIIAIIRESQLDQVREALIEAGISGLTVSRVSGRGQQVSEEIHRGQKVAPSLIPKVRLDIAVDDKLVDITCETITRAAKTGDGGSVGDGKVGDGKFFVVPLEECIRIRTEERGAAAI